MVWTVALGQATPLNALLEMTLPRNANTAITLRLRRAAAGITPAPRAAVGTCVRMTQTARSPEVAQPVVVPEPAAFDARSRQIVTAPNGLNDVRYVYGTKAVVYCSPCFR